MFYLFNRNEDLIEIVDRSKVKEATREEQINSPDTLRVVFNYTPKEAFYAAHKDIINENELHLYKIHNSTISSEGWEITAIESAYDDLAADGYIKDYRPTDKTTKEVVETVLDGSRWELGNIFTTKRITTNFYYLSRLDCLKNIIDLAGVEYKFRLVFDGQKIVKRYVDVYDHIGEDNGKRFVHGSKLLKVIKEEKNSGIYTALVGRGKGEETISEDGEATGGYGRRINFSDVAWSKVNGKPADKPLGQEYVEIPEMTNVFGYPDGKPRIGLVEFEDIEDPEELLQATYNMLVEVSRPSVTYVADVRDAGDTGLGDTVSIIRKDLGIAYKTRIYKRTINLLNHVQVSLELGDKVENYQIERLQRIEKEVTKTQKNSETIMQSVIKIAMNQYWGSDGYNYDFKVGNEYDMPAGMYSYDKPIDQNPSKVIYFGAGMLAIANSKKPDGSWNFTTFATGDGLIGDAIVTNSITANKLAADVGQELDISSNVAITSRVSKTEILTDPEIQEALKGNKGDPGDKGDPGESITIKGSLDSVNDLPPTASEGDVYSVVGADGTTITLYSYTGGKWINIGQLEGGQGTSVSKVTPQYYRSTSKTSVTGGSWDSELPAWKKNTYIWTRLKIDYINPTKTEYTTEVLDTVNNALNEVYNSGTILPSQKPQLLIKLAEIVEEYKALNTEDNKKLDEWTAYESAYTSLSSTLSVLTNDMSATSELDPANFKTLNETYAIAYNNLSQAIDIKLAQDLDTLKSKVTEAETKITDESILATVRKSNEFASGAVTEQVSKLAQTVNGFTASLESTQKNVTDLNKSTKNIRNYIDFSADDDDNGYVELGSSKDALKLRQWRNRISFMNGEIEEAYFSNQAMHVKTVKTGRYEFTTPSETVFEAWYREE